MATIKRNEEQENALKYITDHLAEINQLNPIIMGRFQEVTLSFAVGRGRLGTDRKSVV